MRMVHRMVSGFLLALAVVLTVLPAWAEKPAVFEIPKLSGIKIDGDSSDWGERGFRVNVMIGDGGWILPAANFDPRFRLGWNEQGLLALYTVADSSFVESGEDDNLWKGDSVEMFFAPKLGPGVCQQLLVSPGVDPNHPKLRTFFWAHPDKPRYIKRLRAQVASRKIAGGYVIEVLYPWRNLRVTPKEGMEVPFQTFVNEQNSGGVHSQVRWFPASMDLAWSQVSMYLLRLSRQAGPAVVAAASGAYEQVRLGKVTVAATADLVGKEITLKEGARSWGTEKLAPREDRAGADFILPMPPRGQTYGAMTVFLADRPVAAVKLPDADRARAKALVEASVLFNPYCFTGDNLPSGDFANPWAVESWIGSYHARSSYFNSSFQPTLKAEKDGRYGAILTVQATDGRTFRRFRTLYRTPKVLEVRSNDPLSVGADLLQPTGISPEVAARDAGAISEFVLGRVIDASQQEPHGAALLAGLSEEDMAGPPRTFSNNAYALDRQWWVTMKRKLYGLEGIYPNPFVGPRPRAGKAARVVHTGTPAQAGMRPDAAQKIDAVCRQWAADSDEGFAVCIVRHGVIVLHQAYGQRNGKPMTLTTRSWLASITKLMSATLMMQLIDQGLVKLDDPVEKFLPAFRGIAVPTPLTVRHLYTHTNGLWGQWGDDLPDLEEVIAGYYPYLEVGQRHEYNGVGYALGGKIIEMISGEALPQFFQHHLLGPLGCENTSATTGAWDGQSVPLDMARFGQMLLNGGSYGNKYFFSPATLKQMKPQRLSRIFGHETTTEWGIALTGMNWLDKKVLSKSAFGHGAASSAFLAVDPENDLVIVMTRNAAGKNFYTYLPQFFQAVAQGTIGNKATK